MKEMERYHRERREEFVSDVFVVIKVVLLVVFSAYAIYFLTGCGVAHEFAKEVYRTMGYIPNNDAIPFFTCSQNDHIDGEVKCEVFNYEPFTPKWIAYGEQTTFGDGAVFVFKVKAEKTLVEVGIDIGTEVVYLRAYARRWTNGTIVFERWEAK